MSLAQRLPQIWYDGVRAPLWLRALVPIYRGMRTMHRAPYALGWRQPQHFPVPVIVVGNLTAGGAGKTPLVIALVEALRARGRKPGVLSRGYGGSASSPQLLDASSDPVVCGDEPVLIRLSTGAPVAVGRDRVATGKLLLAAHDCDSIVCDDGLQHQPLFRNVEICVIDGERRFGNGRMLPAGPLREPVSRLDAVDFRVCNGGAAQAGEIPMRLIGDSAVALANPAEQKPLHDFVGQRVHAVAGVGNPARFFSMLRAAGLDVIEHPFADHQVFREQDFDFGDDLPVLMTAKDAIKCQAFARANLWQVPVRAVLPETFYAAIAAKLLSA